MLPQTNLKIVRKCRRTAYPSMERARQVLWIMGTKGINTASLRAVPCVDCHQVHIEFAKGIRRNTRRAV